MADVIRRNHLTGEARHRADEIHIHERPHKRSWLPLVLAAVLALGLFALWNYARHRRAAVEAPAIAPVERIDPALQAPPPPGPPAAPVVPVPQAPALEPEAPKLEAPAAGVADAGAAPSEETAGADASAAPPPEPEAAGSGETCVLTAVTFEPNQTELGDEHQEALRAFAACVKENPEQTITLEGRADPRGNAEYNEGLAKRRAASVAKALEAHGVPGDKLTTSIGTQVCSEATEECWQKNRSVSASAR